VVLSPLAPAVEDSIAGRPGVEVWKEEKRQTDNSSRFFSSSRLAGQVAEIQRLLRHSSARLVSPESSGACGSLPKLVSQQPSGSMHQHQHQLLRRGGKTARECSRMYACVIILCHFYLFHRYPANPGLKALAEEIYMQTA
jgi:hypothetical protein